jgi:tRNA(fMet)-specific endonuclease VapC
LKKYLLDTNIIVFLLRGKHNLYQKMNSDTTASFFISEITLAELKYGVASSEQPEKGNATLANLLKKVEVIPISQSIDRYALEKARLRKAGTPTGDFDLLIGVTSIVHNMIMVTNNTKDFERISEIKLEDWIAKKHDQ